MEKYLYYNSAGYRLSQKKTTQRDSPRQAEIEAGAVNILAPDAGLRMPVF
jgi:hypothetical protein